MTARPPLILTGADGGFLALAYPDGSVEFHASSGSTVRALTIPAEHVERLREWLMGDEDKPTKPEPLPAWECAGPDRWMRGSLGLEWADASPAGWRAYGSGAWEDTDPIGKGDAPSVWHAMHAADKALLAAGHTLTDPAPEPPDLSGVTFSEWGGDKGDYPYRAYPHITTREQADAFLLACGATLEGEA